MLPVAERPVAFMATGAHDFPLYPLFHSPPPLVWLAIGDVALGGILPTPLDPLSRAFFSAQI